MSSIVFHMVSAQISLGIWWLEHNKPYPVEYLAQIATWLSLAGTLRSLGIEEMALPVPPRPPTSSTARS